MHIDIGNLAPVHEVRLHQSPEERAEMHLQIIRLSTSPGTADARVDVYGSVSSAKNKSGVIDEPNAWLTSSSSSSSEI